MSPLFRIASSTLLIMVEQIWKRDSIATGPRMSSVILQENAQTAAACD